MKNYPKFRSAEVIKVIKVEVNEGEGNASDPIRRVCYLTTQSGKVLAKIDEGDRSEDIGDSLFNFN